MKECWLSRLIAAHCRRRFVQMQDLIWRQHHLRAGWWVSVTEGGRVDVVQDDQGVWLLTTPPFTLSYPRLISSVTNMYLVQTKNVTV